MMKIQLKSGIMELDVKKSDIPLEDLCGFACRQNPKRGFLFVSKVLGKHYPVKPSTMQMVFDLLAEKIAQVTQQQPNNTLFLGFAETATGLGAGIFDSWRKRAWQPAFYMHTTRYDLNREKLLHFQEEHSHATGHIVFHPDEPAKKILDNLSTLVLVDDEITTGTTAKNFIKEFLVSQPNLKKVIIVSIKNWMGLEKTNLFKEHFNGIDFQFVSLLEGSYSFTKNPEYVCEAMPNVDGKIEHKDYLLKNNYGRTGLLSFPQYSFEQLTKDIDFSKTTLVLGTGEFHYPPYLLAKYLEEKSTPVWYQSTTRSPISLGHTIESKLEFSDNYSDGIPNFVYNVVPGQYEQVIICYETPKNYISDLSRQLNAHNIFFE